MTRVFSGMQPTGGGLHLGNYLGALVNWVRLQEQADVTYCVVDMHAITMGHDVSVLAERTVGTAVAYMAAGVDPARSTLFVQSHLGDVHGEMTWLFDAVAGVGELEKMPQFREKSEQLRGRRAQVSAGLLTYPVLQTSDILLYDADEVPVGHDQRHHIEIARDIGGRFNHRYGDVFVLPRAVFPQSAARVMDLQDPTAKMSASADSDKGRINLLDEPDQVARKVRSAQTDSGRDVRHDRADKPGISNLLEILSAVTDTSVQDLVDEHAASGYGDFKTAVAEAVVEELRPFQQRHAELADDPAQVRRLLASGADKARAVSAPILARAKQAMGFLPAG